MDSRARPQVLASETSTNNAPSFHEELTRLLPSIASSQLGLELTATPSIANGVNMKYTSGSNAATPNARRKKKESLHGTCPGA